MLDFADVNCYNNQWLFSQKSLLCLRQGHQSIRRCNDMPTVKGSYEAVLIYSVKEGEEAVEALKEKFASLIAANAEAGEVDDWGKRRLAYPINKEEEGYYVLYNFAILEKHDIFCNVE